MSRYTVYTDGSGLIRGPAGIAYVALQDGQVCEERALPIENATNQQAEILAAAYACDRLPEGSIIEVRSDSQYVVKGWTDWLPAWQANGWRKASGGVPLNRAYWERLVVAVARHEKVTFTWLRGHAGEPFNTRADKLAVEARRLAGG